MSSYFFDSSAIVKRYLTEIDSPWEIAITDFATENRILVAEITLVEVAAAFAPQRYHESRDTALTSVRDDFAIEYEIATFDRIIRDDAVALTQRHRLRSYDAIQLATALAIEAALRETTLASPIFVSADNDLLAAASAEGLITNNPNNYR